MARQFLAYNYVGVAWAKIAQMYAIICAHPEHKNDAEIAAVQRACFRLTESCFPKMLADGGKPRYDRNGRIQAVEYRGFRFQALGDGSANEEYFEYVRGYLHANTIEFMTYRDIADTYKVDGYNLSFKNALGLIDDFAEHGYCPDFCGYDATLESRLLSIIKTRAGGKITGSQFRAMTEKERALCIDAIIRNLPVGFVENYPPFDAYEVKDRIKQTEMEYLCKEQLLDLDASEDLIDFHFPEDTRNTLSTVCENTLQLYAEVDEIIYFLPAVIRDGFDPNSVDSIIDSVQTYTELEVTLYTKAFSATYPYRIFTEEERHPYGPAGNYYSSDYNRLPEVEYSEDEQFIGDMDLSFAELTQFKGAMQYIPKDMTLVMLTGENRYIEPENPMARW